MWAAVTAAATAPDWLYLGGADGEAGGVGVLGLTSIDRMTD